MLSCAPSSTPRSSCALTGALFGMRESQVAVVSPAAPALAASGAVVARDCVSKGALSAVLSAPTAGGARAAAALGAAVDGSESRHSAIVGCLPAGAAGARGCASKGSLSAVPGALAISIGNHRPMSTGLGNRIRF